MGENIGLSDILKDVRAASENMDAHHSQTAQRIAAVEKSVDELYVKANRPAALVARAPTIASARTPRRIAF